MLALKRGYYKVIEITKTNINTAFLGAKHTLE